MAKRQAMFSCAECPESGKVFKLDQSPESLNVHYRDCHWGIASFKCGSCGLVFEHKNSMLRHISGSHVSDITYSEDDVGCTLASKSSGLSVGSTGGGSASQDVGWEGGTGPESPVSEISSTPPHPKDLCDVAGEVVMELRSTARLTGAAVERFQSGYNKILEAYNNSLKEKLFAALKSKGMDDDCMNEVWDEVRIFEDPFTDLKTIESQLKFYESKYSLVIPEECFLDSRIDNRLDPKTNEYVPVQVSESFQYLSVIKTMTLILKNKKRRNEIFKDLASKDGVLRSYVDGSDFKDHPFLQRHENVLHICLFYDELEIAAALGSKCIIHRLGVFFFQILNGPAHLKSKLSSIHLLALCYSEDLKKKGAFQKVLFKFVQEMKKLGSDDGVKINLDDVTCTLRAVLVAVAADTKAAHELLGFLGPAARHFCRMCMISRPDFQLNGNSEAPLRTEAIHDQQVLEVQENERLSTQYGVKEECCLNQCPYFHCVDGSVFDCFHDLLEGIVPEVLRFVLRNFIYIRGLFTIPDFNNRIASFSYGIPDSRNKPSPNFTMKMLTSRTNLKQTGTQFWCLIRVFPFLVGHWVPDGDEHMELAFILQDILKLVFSFEIAPDDLIMLDNLVFRFIDNFKSLFVDAPTECAEDCIEIEEDDGLEELEQDDNLEELDVDGALQLGQTKKKKPLKINLFNKLHHIKHYSWLIRRKGPIVRLWCAKYDASLKIFRQYAAICCNFKNLPKTMAQMFQLSHLWSLISDEEDSQVEFGSLRKMSLVDADHQDILAEACISEFAVANKALIRGEEYRPGLFISVKESQSRTPLFCIISDIYVVDGVTPYFVLKAWTNEGLSSKYNAYKISPNDVSVLYLRNALSLENFRPIAPWNTGSEAGDIYVSPRTQVL